MNGEWMLHSAAQRREKRSLKKTVIAKPTINYQKQAVTLVPMATGSPMDFVPFFFFKLLPFTMVHCISPEVSCLSYANEYILSSQLSGWSGHRQAGPAWGKLDYATVSSVLCEDIHASVSICTSAREGGRGGGQGRSSGRDN